MITNPSVVAVTDVTVGTHLVPDDGFPCMRCGDVKIVKRDNEGDLYVSCSEGRHGLDGQLCGPEEHDVGFDHYIGFWLEGEEPAPEELARLRVNAAAQERSETTNDNS